MNNYEYIIAGLPVLSQDEKKDRLPDPEQLVEEIKGQCSGKDAGTVDFLLSSFEPDNLCADLYRKALSHKEKFIREYFLFDLNVRNAKAEYLNKALGRPEDQDVMHLNRKEAAEGEEEPEEEEEEEEAAEFPQEAQTAEALATKDLLEREKALDALYWDKVDEMTLFEIFNLDVILAFLVKLKITQRWLKLDPETGKQMFRQLIENIRNRN